MGNPTEMLFIEGLVDEDILVGEDGFIPTGVEFSGLLGEHSTVSPFFFVAAELNKGKITNSCVRALLPSVTWLGR